MTKHILLTGGAGFIGSHTYVALVKAGYKVSILDNFENAQRDVPARLSQITGLPTPVIDCDIRDAKAVNSAFEDQDFDAVVHFAAKKSVPESETDPIGYFHSNCTGLINVAAAMQAHDVHAIVFSSSAAVYGNADQVPITEDSPVKPENVYARTKAMGEKILADIARTTPGFLTGILRYFNPVGAHPSGLIGEDPSQPPTNLVPVIARVANGDLDQLMVYGGDYPTEDGTGVRDYIHVCDLAEGHVLSLNTLLDDGRSHLVNLGTGTGNSVLEVLKTYEASVGRSLPHKIVPRRQGDAAICFADVAKAKAELGFETRFGLSEMCQSNWDFSGRDKS